MRMKPRVFISFSSQDEPIASALKAKLVRAAGEELDFFLSADDIPAGSNWPAYLEQKLEAADAVVIVMTYAAAASAWVFFEAGYVYSKHRPVIPIGVLGLIVERQPPPISFLQGINMRSCDDLNRLVKLLNERLGTNCRDVFTESDYSELFEKIPSQIPLPRTQPLLSRTQIYRDVLRELRSLDTNVQVRVTATMHDPSEYEDEDFQAYLLALAEKCSAAVRIGDRMTYHAIIGITREADGSIPLALQRAIAYRVRVFKEHGALPRLRLFEVGQRWSMNLLFLNRTYVVFGFPEDLKVPRLQHGFRMSGIEFVSPLVDWYNDCVEGNAIHLPIEQFL
jgi:hypothetical protein